MVQKYDPNSTEWLGLMFFLGSALLSAGQFISIATGFQWRLFWKRLKAPHVNPAYGRTHGIVPMFFNPYMYTSARVLMLALAGFSAFWNWRQGYRQENAPLYALTPDTNPDSSYYFLGNLFYLLFFSFSVFSSWSTFCLGLQANWMGFACCVEFITFGLAVVTTIYFWLVIPLAGILMMVVAIFFLYNMWVCWVFKRNQRRGFLLDQMENMWNYVFPAAHCGDHKYGAAAAVTVVSVPMDVNQQQMAHFNTHPVQQQAYYPYEQQ